MPWKTLSTEKPYSVFVGPGYAAKESRRVAVDYIESLEEQLGSEKEVVRCFRAWKREIELGILALTRAEINDAAAWRAAHYAAFHWATRPLPPGGSLEVIFELR